MPDLQGALLSEQLLLPERPLVIGVAGCSGSGKTTLARELASIFAATLLPLDLYYCDLSHIPTPDRAGRNFDHPDSIELPLLLHHARELIAGQSVERPIYDFSSHTRVPGHTDRVSPAPALIVEGILALHYPELRALFDLSIFVNAPSAVCLARRIHRDVRERGRTEASVREQFRTITQPMADQFVLPSAQYASLQVDGTESLDWSIATVLHATGVTLSRLGMPSSTFTRQRPRRVL